MTTEITEGDRILALASHLGCKTDEIEASYGDTAFSCGSEEYLVMTDEEADDAWDASLESYIDDCLELPPLLANYFDREAWKRDARHDGRGHSLSSYDGEEHEYRLADGTYLYIYRVN